MNLEFSDHLLAQNILDRNEYDFSLQLLNDTMLVISILTIIIILPTLLLKEKKQIDGEARSMMMV